MKSKIYIIDDGHGPVKVMDRMDMLEKMGITSLDSQKKENTDEPDCDAEDIESFCEYHQNH